MKVKGMAEDKRDGCEHLLPQIRETLSWSIGDRIDAVRRDCFVAYPLAEEALAHMEEMLASPRNLRPDNYLVAGPAGMGKTSIVREIESRHPPMPVQKRESEVMLLDSASGNGKTTILQQFETRHPGYWTLPAEVKPVVRVTVPHGGRNDLVTKLLGKLGYSMEEGGALAVKQARAFKGLERCGTKMLILDDINNLATKSSGRVTSRSFEVLKYIREISDDLELRLVFTGDLTAANIIEEETSLRTRVQQLELPFWKNDLELKNFLWRFEGTLSLSRPSFLWKPEKRRLLYGLAFELDPEKTPGRLYYFVRICREAAVTALRSNRESIANEDLEKASTYLGKGHKTELSVK
jgi:hypothetical protein